MTAPATPVLRIDAPPDLQRLHRSVNSNLGVRGVALVCTGMAFAALPGAFIALMSDQPAFGLVMSVLWFAGWISPVIYLRRRVAATEPWYVHVRTGRSNIEIAHRMYSQLEPETQRAYGLPLLEALYRIGTVQVYGERAYLQVIGAMACRTDALAKLVDAEDGVRLYAAGNTLADNSDIDAALAWQDAVTEVMQMLAVDDVLMIARRDSARSDTRS